MTMMTAVTLIPETRGRIVILQWCANLHSTLLNIIVQRINLLDTRVEHPDPETQGQVCEYAAVAFLRKV
jgi:hypothetical protein